MSHEEDNPENINHEEMNRAVSRLAKNLKYRDKTFTIKTHSW